MIRKRNPRRVMVDALRVIKRNTTTMIREWDIRSTVYVPIADREPGQEWLRERRPEEYPENRLEDWRRLAEFAAAIERDARAIREDAEYHVRAKELGA